MEKLTQRLRHTTVIDTDLIWKVVTFNSPFLLRLWWLGLQGVQYIILQQLLIRNSYFHRLSCRTVFTVPTKMLHSSILQLLSLNSTRSVDGVERFNQPDCSLLIPIRFLKNRNMILCGGSQEQHRFYFDTGAIPN